MKQKKGFTLIELLVVVGVISILAATVVVNLRGARERAMDSRVASALGQVRSIAEMIHARTGSYASLCATAGGGTGIRLAVTPTELSTLRDEIFANNGSNAEVCWSSATDYCVHARLLEATQFWCIRSDGRAGRTTGTCISATAGCW